jgi:hypothetical protein
VTKYMRLKFRKNCHPFAEFCGSDKNLLPILIRSVRRAISSRHAHEDIFKKILENTPTRVTVTTRHVNIFYPLGFESMQLLCMLRAKNISRELHRVVNYRKAKVSFEVNPDAFNRLIEMPVEVLSDRIASTYPFDLDGLYSECFPKEEAPV